MEIRDISDKLCLRFALATADVEGIGKIDISHSGSAMVFNLPGSKQYSVSFQSILEDVIEFDRGL